MQNRMDQTAFKNADTPYRSKPFWAWNGKLEEKELKYQLQIFKEMGMGGAFFHSRTGLITEYLGEEWFSLVNACADECERQGMEGWLYDEDRWPSGTAGGRVTENPAYRMHYLVMHIQPGTDFVFSEDTRFAFETDLEGQAFTRCRQLERGDICRGTAVWFSVEPMENQDVYNGNTYVDTMNRDATECFIRMTHERYAEKCGQRLGSTIKGIFTDEPHRGAVMCSFGHKKDFSHALPYTPRLFEAFSNRFGYDLSAHLPELFLQKNGEKRSPVKWQYMELLQELFNENFLLPIQDWCHEQGMPFTGHALHEDTLTTQACMLGSVMRAYEFMDIPGMDWLGEHRRNYWVAVQLRSAARQLGKNRILTELYGCTGWQLSLRSHKEIGDWQALFGANIRCPHLSWYTMEGEAKRDFPASISCQSAWYKSYHHIEEYFSRLHMLLAAGTPVCDTLVINPVESAWAVIHPGWSDAGMATLDEDVQQVEQHYESLFLALAGGRVDFDYGDEHYLKKYGEVRTLEDGTPVLRVGAMTYRTVVVPYMLTIRSDTVALLRAFAERGGRVLFSAAPPQYVDAVPSDAAAMILGERVSIPEIAGRIGSPFVHIDKRFDKIFLQLRKCEGEYMAVLMNMDTESSAVGVTLRFDAPVDIEKWDVRTGQVVPLGHAADMTVDFAPSMELCLRLRDANELPALVCAAPEKTPEKVPLCGPFRYRLSEPNVCVLDMAEYAIDGEPLGRQDVLLADRDIRRRLGMRLRGGDMLQPWFCADKEHPAMGRVRLRFSFDVETMPARLQLAIEHPEKFSITVNGHDDALHAAAERWVDVCFTVMDVELSCCATGRNVIELTTDMREDINLEALFLLGEFGVRLTGTHAVLTAMPEALMPGDIRGQGFPFYGAGITYYAENLPADADTLELASFEGAVIELDGNGKNVPLFAPPYTADIAGLKENGCLSVTCILTRRNTFGPMHFAPITVEICEPDNFETEDERLLCRDGYTLIPQGLLEPPLVYASPK